MPIRSNLKRRGGRPMVGGLILAAGSASRFGSQKLLCDFGGRPLLESAIASACASSLGKVVCVLGSDAPAILDGVSFGRATSLVCRSWQLGQAETLKTGIEELEDAEAISIQLGDEPLVSAEAIERVLAEREPSAQAVRATYRGVAKHPTVIEAELFDRVKTLEGDRGARDLLAGVSVKEVSCDDCASGFDVDTPEDLQLLARLEQSHVELGHE